MELAVKTLTPHVQAAILTGCAKEEDAFLPKTPTIYSKATFQFRRLECTLSLALAMFINKAQRQSLTKMQVLMLRVIVLLMHSHMQSFSELGGIKIVHACPRASAVRCKVMMHLRPFGFRHTLLLYI
jgi:hypothetical protein